MKCKWNSSLCYTINLCCLFYIQWFVSVNPKLLIYPSPPLPLVTINLASMSVNLFHYLVDLQHFLLIPHVSDIIWYLSFFVWLTSLGMTISRPIHVAALCCCFIPSLIAGLWWVPTPIRGWKGPVCGQASLRGPTTASEPVKDPERVTALLPTQPHSPRGGGSGFSTGVQASLRGLTQGSQTQHRWHFELDNSLFWEVLSCALEAI